VRSEIPQLEVVTAIGDAEAEDYIAQLLFSQGWNIVYRAFDAESLITYFKERPEELRTILVYRTDLNDFESINMEELISPTLTMISLDGIALRAHQVMQHIRTQLRLPLIVSAPNSKNELAKAKSVETILVTGTTGAPGRSTVALNIALEKDLPIYDLDFKSPSQSYLISKCELSVEQLKLEDEKPRTFLPKQDAILDIGALPPMDEMVNDRRWHAALLNSTFECSTKLIYVCKASGLSLIRLQKFMDDFPILLKKIPIIYIFNQAGNSREERAMERKFLKMTSGESTLVIPSDLKVAFPVKSGNKSVGKLVGLLT
jgi:hypothetical protein